MRRECETPVISENDHDVAVYAELARQFEFDPAFRLIVETDLGLVLVVENFTQIHALDLIDLVKWLVAAGPQARVGDGNLGDRDMAQIFDLGRYHKSIQEGLEVVDKAHLARLTYAFAV